MIGRLSHIAIAVSNLDVAAAKYRDILGAKVSKPLALPQHGVTTVFVELPNTTLELLEPRIGAHGKPVLFLHPKDFCATLIEIEEH